MNRRGFIGSVFGAAVAPFIPLPKTKLAPIPLGKYYVDIESVGLNTLYPYQQRVFTLIMSDQYGRKFVEQLKL